MACSHWSTQIILKQIRNWGHLENLCCYGMHNDRSIRGMSISNTEYPTVLLLDMLFIGVGKHQTCKFLITWYVLFAVSLIYYSISVVFALFQNKSVHFPLRSKYNRLTKVARFLQENPSCLLCNILHHYLHQANYSIIDDATMVSYWNCKLALKKPL